MTRWHVLLRTSERAPFSGPRTWRKGVLVGTVTAENKQDALALATRDPENKEVRTEVISYPEWSAMSQTLKDATLVGRIPNPRAKIPNNRRS